MKLRLRAVTMLVVGVVPWLAGCSPASPSSAPATATVAPAPQPALTGLTVACASLALTDVGQTSQCRATATYSIGDPQDRTADAQWTSSAVSTVTVSSAGLVTAAAAGDADVSATIQGVSGRQTFHVTVPAKPCEYQLMSPASVAFDERGGAGVISLRATQGANCAWTASASGGMEILDTAGAGDATVRFVVPSYASSTACVRAGSAVIRWNGPRGEQAIGFTQRDSNCGAPGFASVSCGGGKAGAYVPLACYVVVKMSMDPPSALSAVTADVSALGGSSQKGLVRCFGCGEPGYELDLTIPATMQPGRYPITFRVTDALGRSSTAVAMLSVQ